MPGGMARIGGMGGREFTTYRGGAGSQWREQLRNDVAGLGSSAEERAAPRRPSTAGQPKRPPATAPPAKPAQNTAAATSRAKLHWDDLRHSERMQKAIAGTHWSELVLAIKVRARLCPPCATAAARSVTAALAPRR